MTSHSHKRINQYSAQFFAATGCLEFKFKKRRCDWKTKIEEGAGKGVVGLKITLQKSKKVFLFWLISCYKTLRETVIRRVLLFSCSQLALQQLVKMLKCSIDCNLQLWANSWNLFLARPLALLFIEIQEHMLYRILYTNYIVEILGWIKPKRGMVRPL